MRKPWISVLFSRRMFIMLLMGFSSGLPLLLTGSTLQAWMKEAHVDLTVIGLFSLVGLPFTLKFLWSPLMDRFCPRLGPIQGRRRGWLIFIQIALALSLGLLSASNPGHSPWLVACCALLINLFSASQDIVLDAYRREILEEEELGLGSSFFITGYRFGMLVGGAMALWLADWLPWNLVYTIMMSLMLLGIIVTVFCPEPPMVGEPPKNMQDAVWLPLKDYFGRRGAWEILLFILLYKIGDAMASNMTTPFILDIGFTKTQYGAIAKVFGLWATIIGGIWGGVMILRLGLHRSLWTFGVLQMVSTLGFCLLALAGKSVGVLTAVIAFETMTSGMGTSAFVGYMASLVNKRFSATQYALLSSLVGIPRVVAAAPTGWLAKQMGWEGFFLFCTLAALPAFFLLKRLTKRSY